MQNYKYDKAIAPESKNGGSPALNNNPRKGGSKRVLLICLDLFCLFMGEPGPRPPAPRSRAGSPRGRGGGGGQRCPGALAQHGAPAPALPQAADFPAWKRAWGARRLSRATGVRPLRSRLRPEAQARSRGRFGFGLLAQGGGRNRDPEPARSLVPPVRVRWISWGAGPLPAAAVPPRWLCVNTQPFRSRLLVPAELELAFPPLPSSPPPRIPPRGAGSCAPGT